MTIRIFFFNRPENRDAGQEIPELVMLSDNKKFFGTAEIGAFIFRNRKKILEYFIKSR